MIEKVLVAASLCVACDKPPPPVPVQVATIEVDRWIGEVKVFEPTPGVTCVVLVKGRSISCVRDSK